ncbi:MAG: hypothetical protein JSU94_03885 [Phycisphaerales bacterium]|nr:MAG: hypothetical protein JSU94_03885 [Phycisphaerales bacterium]
MNPLGPEQKQLLFDYCLGLTTKKETARAEALVFSHKQATQIQMKLRTALAPLESVEVEPCPDALAERTIERLCELADSSHHRLEQLLAAEETRKSTVKIGFWRNIGEMAAVAAAIILIAGVLLPSLGMTRQRYWLKRCQSQQASIFDGMNRYISEHDGALPTVPAKAGGPWWNIGCPDNESCSSARPLWLLVRLGYVKHSDFVCPGGSQGRALKFDISEVQKYNDFPGRKYVLYSPRIHCPKSQKNCMTAGQPLMADRSPIFEDLPSDLSREIKLRLDEKLLTVNSRNHAGRGQNIVFGDGHVKFVKIRVLGPEQDDIFTLRMMSTGFEIKGCERPDCDTDFFFAP